MCELQQNIVAWGKLLADCGPVSVAVVESLHIHSTLATVDYRDIRAEERSEILPPPAGRSRAVGRIVGHSAVAACKQSLSRHEHRDNGSSRSHHKMPELFHDNNNWLYMLQNYDGEASLKAAKTDG